MKQMFHSIKEGNTSLTNFPQQRSMRKVTTLGAQLSSLLSQTFLFNSPCLFFLFNLAACLDFTSFAFHEDTSQFLHRFYCLAVFKCLFVVSSRTLLALGGKSYNISLYNLIERQVLNF